MRATHLFFPTLREVPGEAVLVSHQLLLRGGFIRRLAAGVYTLLPLGYKVLRKIEEIVRQEMDGLGAQEILMPTLQPTELWMESGRDADFGPEMIRLKDRNRREFTIGGTHEEVMMDLVRSEIRSYRDLPVYFYQIQTKFRDEPRPRGGLIRCREFRMKDLYSFHRTEEEIDTFFGQVREAYLRIFKKCGLEVEVVEAAGGAIGGKETEEFMVLCPVGEDTVAVCDQCGYLANQEKASRKHDRKRVEETQKDVVEVHTPRMTTCEQISEFLKVSPRQIIKTMLYVADDEPVAALVLGHQELNEAKLTEKLGCRKLHMADARTVEEISEAEVGFAGPIEIGTRLVADSEVEGVINAVAGANRTDYHVTGVNPGRDFVPAWYGDIAYASEGDRCGRCGEGRLGMENGIEAGHIFKFGQEEFADKFGATFADADGAQKPIVVGSYGLGTTRLISAVAEIRHDDRGLIWPEAIAPFKVSVLLLDPRNERLRETAEEVYRQLKSHGVDVLLDDRDLKAGAKFKDFELMGVPYGAVLGRGTLEKNAVEIQHRESGARELVPMADAVAKLV